jgi:hypothetical protein
MEMFTTRSDELADLADTETTPIGQVVDDRQELVCGWLKVISGNTGYALVEATRHGCFTWVFSIKGKVTSMQSQTLLAGQRAEGIGRPGQQVGINCDC